jgi:AcrR family transcriptional regulator
MISRKQQIVSEAISIIVNEGYSKMTMRSVARASGIKLGALQYHFPTWKDLLNGISNHISAVYEASFSAFSSGQYNIKTLVDFCLEDDAGSHFDSDRLFPQLWAMALVEPIMNELMEQLYEQCLVVFESVLREEDIADPRAEAIVIVGMLDGISILVGNGRRWQEKAPAATAVVREIINQRYTT